MAQHDKKSSNEDRKLLYLRSAMKYSEAVQADMEKAKKPKQDEPNPVKDSPVYHAWVKKAQAYRESGLPIFDTPDKYEPWQDELKAQRYADVCSINPVCKHKLDGSIKYLSGGYDWKLLKTTLIPCPHCSEENERLRRLGMASKDLAKLSPDSGIPAYASDFCFGDDTSTDVFPRGLNADAIEDMRYFTNRSITALKAGKTGKSFYLHGFSGAGKTVLLSAMLRLYMEAGYACYFTLVLTHLRRIQNTYGKYERSEEEYRYEENLLRVPVLGLDDIGTESPSDWALQKIFSLIEERDAAGLTTIITSNNTLDALYTYWKKIQAADVQDHAWRIVRRIESEERYKVIRIPGGRPDKATIN